MKICRRCGKFKKLEFFWKNQSYCIDCKNDQRKIWKEEQGGKKYHRDYMRKARREIRERLIDLLGGICNGCGITERRVLQIDHIANGGAVHRKKFGIGGYQYYKDMIKSIELGEKKYQLLCANCNYLKALDAHLERVLI